MEKARDIAARILLKIELDNAYSSLSLNEALRSAKTENEKDAALVTALVYGVCERKITLDYNLKKYLSSPLKKLHPAVLTSLRLGAYQILFADRIPDRAAINESVELVKKNKAAFASGLVNAVLRKISSAGLALPEEDSPEYFSVKYSCPNELIDFFTCSYGAEKTADILSQSLGRRPVFIRVNTLKTTSEKLADSLKSKGIEVTDTDIPDCLRTENTGDITQLEEYKNGEFFVQDKSSQTACLILGAQPGETVVDCCAAPGGKTFSSALYMQGKGTLYSCDIYPHKTDLIEKGAERLGLDCIKTVCLDARKLKNNIHDADRVLCDVPCSGFGVIGRKPEIKYKSPDEIKELHVIQSDILDSCCDMVKKGGVLVYSTCTLNPAENENVCDAFLKKHPDFSVCADGYYAEKCAGERYLTIFPSSDGGDGFFTAKFIRRL